MTICALINLRSTTVSWDVAVDVFEDSNVEFSGVFQPCTQLLAKKNMRLASPPKLEARARLLGLRLKVPPVF